MVKKILNLIAILMIIFNIILVPISSANTDTGVWGEIKNSGDDFLSDGKDSANVSSGINQAELDNTIDKVYNLLLTLGIVLSVLIGSVLGIKFIMGSVEEQAKIKEMLLPYVTGCIVTFGAFGIWKMLIKLLSTI